MGGNDACATDVVDSATGAINFVKLLSPVMGIMVDAPASTASPSRASGEGGEGFGGGELTRDPAPTASDAGGPTGEQTAVHKGESFGEYLARCNAENHADVAEEF